MKKIHITEAQRQYLKKRLAEQGELNVTYNKPAMGVASTTDMANQIRQAKQQAPNTDVNLVVSNDDLNVQEKKTYTKKEIQEARVNNLKKNYRNIAKKDI